MQTELNLNLDAQYAALISQFTALNAQLNSFINGDANTTIVTANGTIKSLAGIINELTTFRYVQKIIDIQTYELMIADDLNIDQSLIVRVYQDPTTANNGLYIKQSPGVYTKINYTNLYDLVPNQ